MSIKTMTVDGLNCPFFFCDVCNERVGVSDGAAVFDMMGEGTDLPVFHVHKGKCFDEMERRMGGRLGGLGWDEMADHLKFLTDNTKIVKAKD